MTDRNTLVRLAGLVGIEARYTDALGQTRDASDETLLALTAAFGLPEDPAEAAAEIEESRARRTSRAGAGAQSPCRRFQPRHRGAAARLGARDRLDLPLRGRR